MELLEAFLTCARRAKNRQQLCNSLERILQRKGFRFWAYTMRRDNEHSLLTNYPAVWVDQYMGQDYAKIDPLVDKEADYLIPYLWSQLLSTTTLDKKQNQIFSEAATVGLEDGVAIPIHEPNGHYACLTISGYSDPQDLPQAFMQNKAELYAVAMAFHFFASQLPCQTAATLTARERECLQWIALGKTSWEVGQILKISERTVNFHIENSKKKLNAKTRQQAAAHAIAKNIINVN